MCGLRLTLEELDLAFIRIGARELVQKAKQKYLDCHELISLTNPHVG